MIFDVCNMYDKISVSLLMNCKSWLPDPKIDCPGQSGNLIVAPWSYVLVEDIKNNFKTVNQHSHFLTMGVWTFRDIWFTSRNTKFNFKDTANGKLRKWISQSQFSYVPSAEDGEEFLQNIWFKNVSVDENFN